MTARGFVWGGPAGWPRLRRTKNRQVIRSFSEGGRSLPAGEAVSPRRCSRSSASSVAELAPMPRLSQCRDSLSHDPGAKPGRWMAEVNLGQVLHEAGRTPEAIGHYEKGVRLKPEAKTYYDLGDALMDAGRYPEAEAQYREALRLNPHSPDKRTSISPWLWSIPAGYRRRRRRIKRRCGSGRARPRPTTISGMSCWRNGGWPTQKRSSRKRCD